MALQEKKLQYTLCRKTGKIGTPTDIARGSFFPGHSVQFLLCIHILHLNFERASKVTNKSYQTNHIQAQIQQSEFDNKNAHTVGVGQTKYL